MRKSWNRKLLWLGFLLTVSVCTFSTVDAKKPALMVKAMDGELLFWLHGQYRPRLELLQSKDLNPAEAGKEDHLFISHRARLGMGVMFQKTVKLFLQLQDVRTWGTELNTLGDYSADAFDLHQGWLMINMAENVSFKVGRMEYSLDNERLIGAVGWTQQARSFDGALLRFSPKNFDVQLFYARLKEQGIETDGHLASLWFHWNSIKAFQTSLMGIVRTDGVTKLTQVTTGLFAKGAISNFKYTGEFFYQLGQAGDNSIGAFLAAVSAQYSLNVPTRPLLKVWGEFVSGDEDLTDKNNAAFDTLFATNHKFYGWMDFFLNIPAHTKGKGLMDFGGRLQFFPVKGSTVFFDVHYFRLFSPLKDAQGADQQELGIELNLVAKYAMFKGRLKLLFAFGLMLPQAAFQALGKGSSPEAWGVLQADVSF